MDSTMTLSDELQWRGFVNQTTYSDIRALDDGPITFYWGVDPSADSMHIGQLAMAMMILHFITHGHHAILLVGGATGMIGDPDGKDRERDLKPIDEIERNKTAIAKQYQALFEGFEFKVVDNYDWFKNMNYLDFLRQTGKHFSLTQLLDRDFVKSRIGEGGSGISYAEFSYSLIQGYDFLYLFQEYGVTLQLAGADQWGNSISGVDLVRKVEGKEANIWTAPLVINKATGRKFGKSEGGAVWLDPTKTSPFAFYQFWLNVDDEGAVEYLKLYTLLNQAAIGDIATRATADPSARIAQKTLASEVTALVHGAETRDQVERVTEVIFSGAPVMRLSNQDLDLLGNEIPTSTDEDKTVVELLVDKSIAPSNAEAKRLIQAGAISVNGNKLDSDTKLSVPSLIKKGKNSFLLVR